MLRVNLYKSLHFNSSRVVIDNRKVFSTSLGVHSVPSGGGRKWVKYVKVYIHVHTVLLYVYYVFVYCVGYFIEHFPR